MNAFLILALLTYSADGSYSDQNFYKGAVSLSLEVDGKPNPGPEPEPEPDGDICPTCNGTGKLGDGRIEFPCGDCDGTGRRKKAFNDVKAFERRDLSELLGGSEIDPVVKVDADDLLLAQADEAALPASERFHRIVVLSMGEACRPCVMSHDTVEKMHELEPLWTYGNGPENVVQFIYTNNQKAIKDYRALLSAWHKDNGGNPNNGFPTWILIHKGQIQKVHYGWFEDSSGRSITPRSQEAIDAVIAFMRLPETVSDETQSDVDDIPDDEAIVSTDGKQRRRRKDVELEFLRNSKNAEIDFTEVLFNWAPGGVKHFNDNAQLKLSDDIIIELKPDGDSTKVVPVVGSLKLDYRWGLFEGELDVPYIKIKNDMRKFYLGLKPPLPDYPVLIKQKGR